MSWNIEGLSELKEMEIAQYMTQYEVDICCLQETRGCKSDVYLSHGFSFILSGGAQGGTEWYGVGFVISSRLKRHIRGFCQVSGRIASLKIKCLGGTIALLTVLAPHNLRPQHEKWAFYDQLGNVMSNTSTNGPKYVFGDFNARVGQQRPGAYHIVGPRSFGVEASHQVEMPNRDFLLECCYGHRLAIANRFCNISAEKQVTYHEPGIPPLAPVCPGSFSVLEVLLAPHPSLNNVETICSDRLATLASSHFPVTAVLRTDVELDGANNRPSHRRDWSSLQIPLVRQTLWQA